MVKSKVRSATFLGVIIDDQLTWNREGGGVTSLFYTFYTTLLPFCVWCSEKCSKKGTLNYTFYTFKTYLLKIFFFPIIFP